MLEYDSLCMYNVIFSFVQYISFDFNVILRLHLYDDTTLPLNVILLLQKQTFETYNYECFVYCTFVLRFV